MNLADFENIEAMIEFVKMLDNDDEKYLEMLRAPLVLDANHEAIFEARLETFLLNIFTPPPRFALRRGFGQWRVNLENRYKKFTKIRRDIIAMTRFFKRVGGFAR